jgi:tRNA U34 5-methylaminomethyl-2-thiouridine-forming methyltransferase MnmC
MIGQSSGWRDHGFSYHCNMHDTLKLIVTADGSHTLMLSDMDEPYHSTFGAVTESQHVFIRNGLEQLNKKTPVTVFEIGFGTGLNALLTAFAAITDEISIRYFSLEKKPVDPRLIGQLNYPAYLQPQFPQAEEIFRKIHTTSWNNLQPVTQGFSLCKIQGDLLNFTPDFQYDVVYFDAFAPDKQPGMWSSAILRRIIDHLNPGGIFTTYCAKGSIRRLISELGLHTVRIPGPPGKREMLRAIKP